MREQVVVVMGASSGIGRATAARLAAEGAKVVVSARGEAGLRSSVEGIRAGGGEACAEVADVTDPVQVQRVAQRAVAEYGRLDTWVHAAAVLLVAPFERTTPEEFQRVIDVNLMGQVHGAMAALPHLKQRAEPSSSGAEPSSTSRRWVPSGACPCRPPTARSARALILGEKLAPRLIDALMVRFGFEAHDTGVPKSADAPDKLFAPLDDHNTVRDGFDAGAWPGSLYTSLQRHPVVNRIPPASDALAVVGFLLRPLTR